MRIICGDAIGTMQTLKSNSVDCIVTSPPYYGLRNYGTPGQIGIEETPDDYVQSLVNVFHEARRVLKKEGTVWLNLGDSYSGSGKGIGSVDPKWKTARCDELKHKTKTEVSLKRKNLMGIPWRVAFALQSDGWILRNDIIWQKPNAMPESVKDRLTNSHEYIFLLTKSAKYYFDYQAILEPAKTTEKRPSFFERNRTRGYNSKWSQMYGKPKQDSVGKTRYTGFNERYSTVQMRHKRDVWSVNTKPNLAAHFATYPEELISPCIKAGSPGGGGRA